MACTYHAISVASVQAQRANAEDGSGLGVDEGLVLQRQRVRGKAM
jgi:hypothetical protein